jgi:predicted ABC-type transport system involved in lysophospholipase L1 biosynthesis ATPase subunit
MGDAELSVLRHVDFDLRPGEFVAIEGRSGSGKSTLLHVLAALDSVDGGTLSFDGHPYTRRTPPPPSPWRVRLLGGRGENARSWWLRVACYIAVILAGLVCLGLGWTAVMHVINDLLHAPWADPTPRQTRFAQIGLGLLAAIAVLLVLRWAADVGAFAVRLLGERPAALLRNKKFGFVFQSYHLLPELNVLENTLLAPSIEYGPLAFRSHKRQLRDRATELLTQLGMSHRLTHRTSQLSGGERQRVAIARALMNRPAILFADEPTGNLDVETGRQIMDLLEALHRDHGQTIVMVTHDRSLAREADRVLVLKDGRLEQAV